MSKYVKNLLTKDVAGRLEGVDDALLVNVIGMDANSTVALRRRLREKSINLLVVKNSLAQRATAGTGLENAFNDMEGTLALVWGAEDFVSLAKEVAAIEKDVEFENFGARGGVMDGEQLTAERVIEISKWPSRLEQISILVGQALAPGAALSSQMIASGGAVASQIEQVADGESE
jgi:large subunit ribosomal protein L10